MGKWKDENPVRDRLELCLDLAHEIDVSLERLAHLEDAMTTPKTSSLDGMPHGSGSFGDRTASLVTQKDSIERMITEKRARLSAEQGDLESIVSRLKKADERMVIRLRYFDCVSWPEVNAIMFGRKDDFEERDDVYLKRIFRYHGTALLNMAAIYSAEQEGEAK